MSTYAALPPALRAPRDPSEGTKPYSYAGFNRFHFPEVHLHPTSYSRKFGIINPAVALYRYINSLLYDRGTRYDNRRDITESSIGRKHRVKWDGEGAGLHGNQDSYEVTCVYINRETKALEE